jgi:Mce-associated membrane protein
MEGDAGESQLNPTGPREREVPPADRPQRAGGAPASNTESSKDGLPQAGVLRKRLGVPPARGRVPPAPTSEKAVAGSSEVADSSEAEVGEEGVAEEAVTQEAVADGAVGDVAVGDVAVAEARVADEAIGDEAVADEAVAPDPVAESPGPSRLGRAWMGGVAAALLLLSAGVVTGGYFTMRAHKETVAQAHADSIALAAAKDCVAATQAPDTAAMVASQQKMIECSTGAFAVQATVFSGVLVDAYQAANVQVKVTDMRAAVERHNDDGSMEVLIALRINVTNSAAANQEEGYRLRVRMAPADGTYKIARLDQVSS